MKKIIVVLFAFIAIESMFAQQLGTPTQLQRILNELPAIPIAGRNLKFQFGGTTWIATVNGENALAGTVETVDINGGSILTLKQTHVWAGAAGRAVGGLLGGGVLGGAVGNLASTWVATPGPEIVLDYSSTGPRATLSMASEARIAEARVAGAIGTGSVNLNISGYFVGVNGLQTGPYDTNGLQTLISQGQLTRNSLVWKEGMSNWIVAGAVEELAPLFSTGVPPPLPLSQSPPPIPGQVQQGTVQIARNTSGNDSESKFALGLQAGRRFGLKVHPYNNSSFNEGNTGFYASLYGAYAFTSFISLQTGLAFSFNDGCSLDGDYFRMKYTVLDIPVLPTFTWHPLQNFSIKFNIGPLLSVALSDIEEPRDTYYFNNRFSLGILIGTGVGYRIGKGSIIFDIRAFVNSRWDTTADEYSFENLSYRHGVPLILLGYEYWF